jgi:hypothetical protein
MEKEARVKYSNLCEHEAPLEGICPRKDQRRYPERSKDGRHPMRHQRQSSLTSFQH